MFVGQQTSCSRLLEEGCVSTGITGEPLGGRERGWAVKVGVAAAAGGAVASAAVAHLVVDGGGWLQL